MKARLAVAAALALVVVPAAVAVSPPGGDTTPPTMTAASENVTANVNGVASAVVEYAEPVASDAVDGPVPVSCAPQSGATFKLGTTRVTCTAVDSHGNRASLSFDVVVQDTQPPPWVVRVDSSVAGTTARVSWQLPNSPDAVGVVVARTPGVGGANRSVVYRGSARSFTDRRLKPGVTYAYEASTVDRANNVSAPVRAFARVAGGLLSSPFDGEELTAAPMLTWKPVGGANYYNVQLWAVLKQGEKKLLSIWPTTNQLALTPTWTFKGVHYRLVPGTYRWYVWPGYGAISRARYGKLLGSNTFLIVSS
jgi:hypothetical protein